MAIKIGVQNMADTPVLICLVSDFRTNMDDYTGRPVAEN